MAVKNVTQLASVCNTSLSISSFPQIRKKAVAINNVVLIQCVIYVFTTIQSSCT